METMMEFGTKSPTIPISFHKLLNVSAIVDRDYRLVCALLRYPGIIFEVQGIYQEQVDGRIKFYTDAVRE